MISKESMTRQRLKPRIWDPHYILAKKNLKNIIRISRRKNVKILDIGCGYKPFKELFSYKEYIGIDFDKKSSDADLIMDSNKEAIPYSDNYFDIIIFSDSLEHLHNTDFVIEEAKRVLKKGGYLLINTPFLFCEHGTPHDYYRFTKYFYKNRFNDCKSIELSVSNSFISSPLILCNQVLEHLPISIFRIPFLIINNVCISIIDSLLYGLVKDPKLKDGLDRGYEEISVIIKK